MAIKLDECEEYFFCDFFCSGSMKTTLLYLEHNFFVFDFVFLFCFLACMLVGMYFNTSKAGIAKKMFFRVLSSFVWLAHYLWTFIFFPETLEVWWYRKSLFQSGFYTEGYPCNRQSRLENQSSTLGAFKVHGLRCHSGTLGPVVQKLISANQRLKF